MSELMLPTGLSVSQFIGLRPGPKLIVLGAVHGNETCGTEAIQRTRQEIERGVLRVECGTLTMLPIANPLAYQLKRRHGDRNLNRNMRITNSPQDFEDAVSNLLCPLLHAHDALLDLHSFHTPGIPFALIGPCNNRGQLEPFAMAEEEEALALHLGVDRFVEGWLEPMPKVCGIVRRGALRPIATMVLARPKRYAATVASGSPLNAANTKTTRPHRSPIEPSGAPWLTWAWLRPSQGLCHPLSRKSSASTRS